MHIRGGRATNRAASGCPHQFGCSWVMAVPGSDGVSGQFMRSVPPLPMRDLRLWRRGTIGFAERCTDQIVERQRSGSFGSGSARLQTRRSRPKSDRVDRGLAGRWPSRRACAGRRSRTPDRGRRFGHRRMRPGSRRPNLRKVLDPSWIVQRGDVHIDPGRRCRPHRVGEAHDERPAGRLGCFRRCRRCRPDSSGCRGSRRGRRSAEPHQAPDRCQGRTRSVKILPSASRGVHQWFSGDEREREQCRCPDGGLIRPEFGRAGPGRRDGRGRYRRRSSARRPDHGPKRDPFARSSRPPGETD